MSAGGSDVIGELYAMKQVIKEGWAIYDGITGNIGVVPNSDWWPYSPVIFRSKREAEFDLVKRGMVNILRVVKVTVSIGD